MKTAKLIIKYGEKKSYVKNVASGEHAYAIYCKIPKFSDTRKLCCNLPKIQTKRPNLRVFRQKDANGIANSEDPDQTAPLGAV